MSLPTPPSWLEAIYGVYDADMDAAVDWLHNGLGELPSPFLQIRFAVGDLHLGRTEQARRRVEPWLARPEVAFEGLAPVMTLALMSRITVALDESLSAPPIAHLLEEFSGLLATESGHSPEFPVDFHLAALALVARDADRAAPLAQAALEFSRGMPSPPLEARCLALLADAQALAGRRDAADAARASAEAIAEPIGLVLPGGAATAPSSRNDSLGRTFRLQPAGSDWIIETREGAAPLSDMIGVQQLCRLLTAPGSKWPPPNSRGSVAVG